MKSALKTFLRKQYIDKRESLSSAERSEKSRLIRERVLRLPEFLKAETCLIYASFRNEVETDLLGTAILKQGKRLALPITVTETKSLLLCEIRNGFDDLIPSTFGIREPQLNNDLLLCPQEIDLFIVPGVAFDLYGNRLGYGGGYYDRLLTKMKNKTILALAYEIQIASRLVSEENDVRMTKILTEERIIDCINNDVPAHNLIH